MKRLVLLGAGIAIGVALTAGVLAGMGGITPTGDDVTPAAVVTRASAPVTRETLRYTEDLDATLGYDGSGVIPGWIEGTADRKSTRLNPVTLESRMPSSA